MKNKDPYNHSAFIERRFVQFLFFLSLLIVSFFTILSSSFAQQSTGSIHGKVYDSANDEPLSSANIYLSNTTLGTISRPDGSFEIKNIPPGNYTLVFRFIGYKQHSMDVEIREDDVLIVDKIQLEPDLVQLEDISVKASRSKEWQRNLKDFETAFLGSSSNAAKTEIKNPEIINFSKDSNTNNLLAEADDEIHIVNEALGYEIFITLSFFSWNIRNDAGSYFFTARFEELEPANEDQIDSWREKRETTYFGSFRHFLKSLADGEADNKFHYLNGYVEPKEEPATEEEKPDLIQVLFNHLSQQEEDVLQFRIVRYRTNSPLKIRYRGARRYESEIEAKHDEYLYIDRFGNLLNPENVIFSGFWSNYRIADFLPFDYLPDSL